MATGNKSKPSKANTDNKKRKNRYLPYNKPVKKGSYPLRPGVQGFFITCDGGRERQASHEALNVIDSFYEELVHGRDSNVEQAESSAKPLNKKIKFTYSDSSSCEDESEEQQEEDSTDQKDGNDTRKKDDKEQKDKDVISGDGNATHETVINRKSDTHEKNGEHCENQITGDAIDDKNEGKHYSNPAVESEEPPMKKLCVQTDAANTGKIVGTKTEEKSIDKLIEAELAELGDKSKRRFSCLDSGCNGVVFVRMCKRNGDPSPKDVVQYMMTSVASMKKHMSRFMLRVLPVEVTCYASEEEISRAIKPLIEQYFPVETQNPWKFAVLYEARANSGIDRMTIIDTIAKSVPGPHKVDLKNPDINIVAQVCKTVCLMGIVEKYKELAKYNLRQLTS